ncbi:autotransporter-associated beta strand repeat-containing protein [Thauera sinica]|uniref:Autotransporter-associated beta strand repeat-containing protein n=1 Tax=Thauera sinica TaxID=2665146 RepID=A0ABW1AMD0_9RHOO|nr:autotransporter-associated beta strand repeat-containing protein [Thauera sp. K11]
MCTGTTNATVGSGPSTASGATVTINGGAQLNGGNASAISLGDNATITVNSGASVLSTAGSSGGNGLWGAGRNTIEFNSNGTLTIAEGASVRALGASTNAEAINLIGSGNTVINRGLISGLNSAAIWFEDKTLGTNTIDNYGTIQRGSGSSSVIDNVIGNQSHSDVNFINRAGAVVYGGLSFASGNDTLTLFPGSVISGGFNGGGGTNALRLEGAAGSSDALPGNISNFQTLIKAGEGRWTLSGTVGSNGGGTPLAVTVQQGTLALTGNNVNFNGSVVVDPAGTLEARAQSLPPSVTDNGLVHFVQPDNGSYSGVIGGSGAVLKTGAGVLTLSGANGYAGGTTIRQGTVAIDADNRLGAAGSPLTLDGGTLEITSSFDLSPSRALTVTASDGTIQTDGGVTSTVSQGIAGAGTLTKSGAGTLILSGANTYADGTTISGGTLQIGNGGTTGSIVGDVIDNGVLAFNRSDRVSFGGTISGSGAVVHAGAGVTVLSGNNSYAGATTIASGWLYVDGSQTGATGPTTAAAGTRLGGNGIVGGDVTIADNATLAPGAEPQTPGALTIQGSLTLNPNSFLLYNLVQANVAGGALNDLTVVQGNLVLDGIIDVANQGQVFGPGVYRIINYGGTLTNNGLTIGSLVNAPASPQDTQTVVAPLTGFTVQTSIQGQVNLVNTGGLALNYWDVVPKNDDAIEGGTGTWQASPGTLNDNWTDSAGDINAPWLDGGYAIFMATPGTVTVDNGLGAVTSRGMQFASDGYRVTGQPLTLLDSTTGNITFVRVGDGTAAGAAMTATIDAELTGGGLVKEDLGTLVLDGVNTYTNGTGIFGGTLRISQDANLGVASSALIILNGSTLNTTASFDTGRTIILGSSGIGASSGTIATDAGTRLTVNGAIVEDPSLPAAALVKAGDGELVLTSTNTYSGGTTIAAGTLQLGNGGTTGSILGNVADNGVLAFNRSDTYVFGGAVSGSGELHQIGSGTTVLTNASTYSGGTAIGSGTLQLGDGGTTGSIAGDVANDGRLVFDRADRVTFDGEISGSGEVVQAGAGVTILTGDNSYDGPTTISNGWLYINGNQSAANGPTTAASGTRLGGDGTVGGDVVIADNATLGPGSQPQTPATLTIEGNLTLNPNAILFYNIVQANVAGGALNDLTVVQGDLILDGIINVVDFGQTLGPGIYRIFNYGGSLSIPNDGLQLGSYMTAPATPQEAPVATGPLTGFFVQTAVPNQVNLVNTAGLALNYWDGDAGPKNNDVINGGDGVWHADAGVGDDNNWTNNPGGNPNAPWQDTAFAVFMATPGTVTVDDTNGTVRTIGMQFASSGYLIQGDPITLVPDPASGGVSFIRVGDGTAASTAVTATIASPLNGGALFKEDLGTLILTGTNSYTGGTGISGGTLQVSRDENLGAASGALAILNGSTLRTTASFGTGRMVILGNSGIGTSSGTIETDAGTRLTLDGAIVEAPSLPAAFLTKAGDGTLVLTNANTYSGGTIVEAGTLQVGGGGTSGSILNDVDVAGGATLAFNRSDSHAFGGMVSGAGELRQIGSGSTVLTNDSTYTGGTFIDAGTLQLGNGGTTGSILGDVADEGTLAFNRSDTYTFGGIVSGGGELAQRGSGTTVLTSANTYTGGTTITQGTLQIGDGGTTGSIVGNVADEGTLAFERSDAYVFAGVVSGGGQLDQIGTGTTILTGDSTYTGRTTIAAGVLQLGDGGTSGSIVGPVVDNAVLAVDRSDAVTLPGQITGTGAFVQRGTGTTVFTANNTYSGGTTIERGTLQLGDGGSAGNFFGDVLDDGTLAFERSDLLPFTGNISGSGKVVQQGTGDTVLFGTNSYGGTTDIVAGGLYVNGDQRAATGLTTAQGGGTLGGTGIIGGSVAIAAGATLAPGDIGTVPGTLTIRQNLDLDAGSVLAYQFGQANVVGGAFNDLTVVEGDLTLAGTIDVALTEGGAFDVGIYRIISYAGSMNNGVLDIGTLPTGSDAADYFVQTAVANQVNLAYTAGLELNFWDGGDPGPEGNGQVFGGNGTWHASAGVADDDNWTNGLGIPNAAWSNAAFAIFMGAPGTVDVDEGLGEVRASGMQFASDGYRIQGGGITLVDSVATPERSLIRVGDGSEAGRAFTATIAAELRGDTTLVKTDLGTLVLEADNTYSGGTAVTGGVLQISRDANLGQAGTALSLDDGTLRTTADVDTTRPGELGELGGTLETVAGTRLGYGGAIAGPGSLTKTGDGTLVLTQANGYAGGTWVKGGTLQISTDANLGEATADLTIEGGTLHTTGDVTSARGVGINEPGGTILTDAGTAFTLNGVFTGLGTFVKDGGGTLVIAGNGAGYSSTGTVAAGTLAVDGVLGGYRLFVDQGARLEGTGQVMSVINRGTVAPGRSIGTLTIAGDYTSDGGALEIEAALGGDASPTDLLVVTGDTAGSTEVVVINRDGLGAQTSEGIRIVDVGGASGGVFTLRGDYTFEGQPAVIAGAYGYRLYKNGIANPADGDWYLRSALTNPPEPPRPPAPPLYQPGVPVYEAYPKTLLALNGLPTLQQRIGNRAWGGDSVPSGREAWGRVEASHHRFEPASSSGRADQRIETRQVQVGIDRTLRQEADGGTLIGGVNFRHGEADARIDSIYGDGSIETRGHGVGGTLTWYGADGYYVDGQAQFSWYDSDLKSAVLGKRAKGNDGTGYAVSAEAGRRIALERGYSMTPQAQVVYSSVDFDRFTDSFGAHVSPGSGDSLKTRFGVSLDYQDSSTGSAGDVRRTHVYGIANLTYEWLGGTRVEVSGTDIAQRDKRLWGEFGVGGSYTWKDGRYALYGEISADTPLDGAGRSSSLKGSAGFRARF